jgi:hypothetical protein
MGQGEYIVFHKLENNEKRELDEETFEQVYAILNEFSPAAIMNRGSEKATEESMNRYEIIRSKVKEIDSTLEIVFVPRTLHELIFIRECINEDLKLGKVCEFQDKSLGGLELDLKRENEEIYNEWIVKKEIKQKERKCWHLCCFEGVGDDNHAGVKKVAFRLNQIVIDTLQPSEDGFTHLEISKKAGKEIEFLKTYYLKVSEDLEKISKGEKISIISSCVLQGPTTTFGSESIRGGIKPMGIRNDWDAQIILNAIALECSKIAEKSFLLYRGSNFKEDSVVEGGEGDWTKSLSYGSSLFAGVIFDGGATAFHYIRNEKNNGYVVSVPFDQLNRSPFFIPPTNFISQLFAHGEMFHGRTKAWKDCENGKIQGIVLDDYGSKNKSHISELDKEDFIKEFEMYKDQAIQLK